MLYLTIIDLDEQLFKLINQDLVSGFLDIVLYWWRNKYTWIPLYIFLIGFLIFNYRREAYWLIFFLVFNFGLTDFVSSSILKPTIERARPCHEANADLSARVLVDCGSGYSFTSSHAANHFGIAFFLIFTLVKRNKLIATVLLIWASLVAYAQVYVGVHFPLDVFCGALLGIGIALLTSEVYKFSKRKMAI